MFLYPSAEEGLAWLEASDTSWAHRAVSAYLAAAERTAEDPAEDAAS